MYKVTEMKEVAVFIGVFFCIPVEESNYFDPKVLFTPVHNNVSSAICSDLADGVYCRPSSKIPIPLSPVDLSRPPSASFSAKGSSAICSAITRTALRNP